MVSILYKFFFLMIKNAMSLLLGPRLVPQSTTKEIRKEADGTFTLHFENGTVSLFFLKFLFLHS